MDAMINNKDQSTYNIKWGAVFAGVIASLAASVLLNFLGIGVGLTSFDMDADTLINTGIGSVIWLALSGIVSMSLGGFITGRFTSLNNKTQNGYHGILAWCLATLITIAVTTTGIGSIMGGATSIIGNSAKAIAQNPVLANKSKNLAQNTIESNNENMTQEEVKKATESASKAIGQASISIVAAFLLSLVASLVTSMAATKKS